MKCVNCKRQGEILLPSLGKSFCKNCYAKAIERRVRRLATVNKLFKRGIKVKVRVNNSNDLVLHHILSKRFKHVKVIKSAKPSMPQHTLDELCIQVFKALLKTKPLPKLNVSLIEVLDEDEIKAYAITQGLKYKPIKRTGQDLLINKMLLSIKQDHPNALFSIRRIIRRLQ